MTRFLLGAAFIAAAGVASAQPAPPPTPPAPPSDAPASPPATRPAPAPPGSRGAVIRISRPDISVSVRCAEGDTTRACGEIVAQLIEKLSALPPSERGKGGGGDGWFRDTDRPRGGSNDRRDGDPSSGGDRRPRGWE